MLANSPSKSFTNSFWHDRFENVVQVFGCRLSSRIVSNVMHYFHLPLITIHRDQLLRFHSRHCCPRISDLSLNPNLEGLFFSTDRVIIEGVGHSVGDRTSSTKILPVRSRSPIRQKHSEAKQDCCWAYLFSHSGLLWFASRSIRLFIEHNKSLTADSLGSRPDHHLELVESGSQDG